MTQNVKKYMECKTRTVRYHFGNTETGLTAQVVSNAGVLSAKQDAAIKLSCSVSAIVLLDAIVEQY
jgi:hypothetical protein